jgi:hypothetical protein
MIIGFKLDEITLDVKQNIQDKTLKHTKFHTDALTHSHTHSETDMSRSVLLLKSS